MDKKEITDKKEISEMETYLRAKSQQRFLPPDHLAYLWELKRQGFNPKVIYDIGACLLHWSQEARRVWPDARIILFEASTNLEFLYSGYDYHLGVLSSPDKPMVKFYHNNYQPGGNSYYLEVGNPNSHLVFSEENQTQQVTATLSQVVARRGFPLPDLIKIDVQGSEKDIIQGSPDIIQAAQHLLVEMQCWEYNRGAPLVSETLPYIESLGFKCVAPLFCNSGVDGDYGFKRI